MMWSHRQLGESRDPYGPHRYGSNSRAIGKGDAQPLVEVFFVLTTPYIRWPLPRVSISEQNFVNSPHTLSTQRTACSSLLPELASDVSNLQSDVRQKTDNYVPAACGSSHRALNHGDAKKTFMTARRTEKVDGTDVRRGMFVL